MRHKLTLIWRLMPMLEPYQVAGNQAAPATGAEAVPDNLALVEQMLATFTFVDNDTLVGNATPTP